MISTQSINSLLKGVRAEFAYIFDQSEKQIASYNSNVYLDASTKTGALFEDINAVGRQRMEATSVTGVGQFQPTSELQEFIEDNYVPSYITSVEPYKFTKRIKVSQESADRRDTMYLRALNEVSKERVASENTMAQHKFDRFNKAFSVVTQNYLFDYGDGVALCASNHPTKKGGTQTNIVTASDISPTSIESMNLVMQNWTDDNGIPMPMGGGMKYIVVPPAKVRKAKQNIDSEWDVDTANNNINVWRGQGFVLVSSPWTNSSNGGSDKSFYLVDGLYSPLKNVTFKPFSQTTWYDENIKAFVHDAEFQHKVGAFDFRGIVGNPGA